MNQYVQEIQKAILKVWNTPRGQVTVKWRTREPTDYRWQNGTEYHSVTLTLYVVNPSLGLRKIETKDEITLVTSEDESTLITAFVHPVGAVDYIGDDRISFRHRHPIDDGDELTLRFVLHPEQTLMEFEVETMPS